ncbi:MAG TPA: phosphatidylglycerophosphatase A [Gammaproteobacteria bacterium]|nr:phosphatidylglycerophosphatase A [Gammaproteobacteria bacterium]
MSRGTGDPERRPTARRIFADPVLFLATGFGAGLAPVAPGTAGSLVGLALYFPLAQLPAWGYALAVALASVAGIPVCAAAGARLGAHDHPGVVWDEIAGMLLAMLPAVTLAGGWRAPVAGFLLFRLFDIAKPGPIGRLDRALTGGAGVMVDDLLAGGCAAAVLWALLWWRVV